MRSKLQEERPDIGSKVQVMYENWGGARVRSAAPQSMWGQCSQHTSNTRQDLSYKKLHKLLSNFSFAILTYYLSYFCWIYIWSSCLRCEPLEYFLLKTVTYADYFSYFVTKSLFVIVMNYYNVHCEICHYFVLHSTFMLK